jgi:hypothetical protein
MKVNIETKQAVLDVLYLQILDLENVSMIKMLNAHTEAEKLQYHAEIRAYRDVRAKINVLLIQDVHV